MKLKKQGDIEKLVQPSSMTEWEKQQEIEEFAKASVFFQPLNNVLSSRFESKSHLSVEHEVMSELEKLKKEKELNPIVPVKRKLIGISNRKSFEWHPGSLLCKRMNVPNPFPNESSGAGQSIIKSSSVFDHLSFSETILSSKAKESDQETSSTAVKESKVSENKPSSPPVAATISTIPLISENLKESSSENTKPPIDFFKAIFANSSDEESEDEETNQSNTSKVPDEIASEERKSPETSLEHKSNELSSVNENNHSASQKVGFGVFANLDLDALNEKKAVKPSKPQNHSSGKGEMKDDIKHSESLKTIDDSLKKFDEWTPELPPNFKIPSSLVSNDLKKEPCHSKKQKAKHHHKHKHHKHKSKKKKKKKHESSSESEDDIDDVPPTLIIQKLKELQKKSH